jgi:hypothetical protein
VSPASTFRWGGRATFDALFLEPHDGLGYGGSLATTIELSGETKGSFSNAGDDGFAAGLGYGQWAIGAFLGGSARRFPDAHYLGVTAGISARIPLVFGLACCLGLGDDDDDDDDAVVTRTKSRPRPAEPPRRRYVPAKPTPVSSLAPTRIHVPSKAKPVDGG